MDQTQQIGNAGIDRSLLDSLGYVRAGAGTARNDLMSGFGGAAGAVNYGTDTARGILDSGTLGALDFVGGGAGRADQLLAGGARGATGALAGGAGGALGYLNAGTNDALSRFGTARTDLQGGGAAYDPLSALAANYGQGRSLYQDALGINGPGGNARAVGAFEAGPGYNFQLDQGLDAINRRRNAGGMLASGNADRDAQIYGQGLAKQEYGNWLNNLGGFVSPELQATSGAATGRAGIARDLAGLSQSEAGLLSNAGTQRAGVAGGLGSALAGVQQQSGAARAGVATDTGRTLADVLRGGAAASAGLESGRGGTLADILAREGIALGGGATNEGLTLANLTQGSQGQRLGLTNSVLQPYNQTYGQEAAAQMQGSGNLWNLGINAAKLFAGLPPGTFGGGSAGNYGGSPATNPFLRPF